MKQGLSKAENAGLGPPGRGDKTQEGVKTVPSLWLHRGHGHNIDGIVGVEQGGAEVRDLRSRSEWEQRAELRQLHYQGP